MSSLSPAPLPWQLGKAFNPNQPRGKDGRWIDKIDVLAAANDPDAAARLLVKVRDADRQKLVNELKQAGMTVDQFRAAKELAVPESIAEQLAGVKSTEPIPPQVDQWFVENTAPDDQQKLLRRASEIRLSSMGLTIEQASMEYARHNLTSGYPNGIEDSHETRERMRVLFEAYEWHHGQENWYDELEKDKGRVILADPESYYDKQLMGAMVSARKLAPYNSKDATKEEHAIRDGLEDQMSLRKKRTYDWIMESEPEDFPEKIGSIHPLNYRQREILVDSLNDKLKYASEPKYENQAAQGYADLLSATDNGKYYQSLNDQHGRDLYIEDGGTVRVSQDQRSMIKSKLVVRVAERMAQKIDQQTATKFVDAVTNRSTHQKMYGLVDDTQIATNQVVQQWAQSSGNGHKESIAMQVAIGRRFGLDHEDLGGSRVDNEREGLEHYQQHRAVYDAMVNSIYEETQDHLKQAGVENLTVFRGMAFDGRVDGDDDQKEVEAKIELFMAGAGEGYNAGGDAPFVIKDTEIESNPASSYSLDYKIAREFASGGTTQVMVTESIPREQVFSTFMTGIGASNEAEIVVLGVPRKSKLAVGYGSRNPFHDNPTAFIDSIRNSRER